MTAEDDKKKRGKLPVSEMKKMKKAGVKIKEIAKISGVTEAYVSSLLSGKYYRRLKKVRNNYASIRKQDAETDCLVECLSLINKLNNGERVRVAKYIKEKYLS